MSQEAATILPCYDATKSISKAATSTESSHGSPMARQSLAMESRLLREP
jgi:hypothetical protein